MHEEEKFQRLITVDSCCQSPYGEMNHGVHNGSLSPTGPTSQDMGPCSVLSNSAKYPHTGQQNGDI